MTETCTATAKKTGQRCKANPVAGSTVCRLHGGSAPQVRKAGLRRLQQADLEKRVGEVLELVGDFERQHPIEVLLDAVHEADSMRRMFGQLVAFLGVDYDSARLDEKGKQIAAVWGVNHLGDQAPHVLTGLHGEWADRAARLAKVALDANLDERLVRMSELQTNQVFACLVGTAAELGVPFDEPDFRSVFARRLREIEQGGDR